MASTLSNSKITIGVNGVESDPVGVGNVTYSPSGNYTAAFATGTSAGQANCRLIIAGSVTSGTPVSIDLTSIATAGISNPTTLTSIKSLTIQNTTGTTGYDITMGDTTGAISNEFTAFWGTADGADIVASDVTSNGNVCGGMASHTKSAGYTVDSTHKILTIKCASGTATYVIDITGTK